MICYSDTVSAVPFGIEFPRKMIRVIKRTLFRTVPGTINTRDKITHLVCFLCLRLLHRYSETASEAVPLRNEKGGVGANIFGNSQGELVTRILLRQGLEFPWPKKGVNGS